MEQGTVKSYNRESGTGTIGRSENSDVRFNVSRILGNRNDIKQGDRVWFEMEVMQSNHFAINIRKCM